MGLTQEDRILIKALRLEKGYGAKKMMKEFPARKWSRSALNRLIATIDSTGSAERKQRICTSRSRDNIAAVEELVLSQEDQPSTHRSTRQIARETGIAGTSVWRIIHKDLRLTCFKKKRAQELTEANKITRLVRAKQLLKKYPEQAVGFIWFTDEKLFTVAAPVNMQNDRVYAPAGSLKRHLSAERLLRTRSTYSKSVIDVSWDVGTRLH
jgi:hypothetical protein